MTFPSTRLRRPLVLSLAVAAAAVAVVLLQGTHSDSAAAGPAVPSQQVLGQFAIFTSSSSAVDKLPSEAGPTPAAASVVRSIATNSSAISQWATLNGKEACVVIDGTDGAQGAPSSCADLEAPADESELLTIAASSSDVPNTRAGAATIVAGLAPNGVSAVTINLANGTAHTAPVVDNGFHLLTGGSEPTGYVWTTGAGVKHVQNMKGN
jgi:hypothetical protein